MEEARLDWADKDGLERCHRRHAQRLNNKAEKENDLKIDLASQNWENKKTVACRFYQRDKCFHSKDHDKDNVSYKHICLKCFAKGLTRRHMVKIVPPDIQKTSKALRFCSAKCRSSCQ